MSIKMIISVNGMWTQGIIKRKMESVGTVAFFLLFSPLFLCLCPLLIAFYYF